MATINNTSAAVPAAAAATATATATTTTTATSTGTATNTNNTSNSSIADSRFSCNICFEDVNEPVVTRCGHLYCWPCLFRWYVMDRFIVVLDIIADVHCMIRFFFLLLCVLSIINVISCCFFFLFLRFACIYISLVLYTLRLLF